MREQISFGTLGVRARAVPLEQPDSEPQEKTFVSAELCYVSGDYFGFIGFLEEKGAGSEYYFLLTVEEITDINFKKMSAQ